MPVNPYDGRGAYLRWPHEKGDFDIVNSSEGKLSEAQVPLYIYTGRRTSMAIYGIL